MGPGSTAEALSGWKLHREPGQAQVAAAELDRRCAGFRRCDWAGFFEDAARSAAPAAHCKGARDDDVYCRTARVVRAACPRSDQTLAQLRDPECWPPNAPGRVQPNRPRSGSLEPARAVAPCMSARGAARRCWRGFRNHGRAPDLAESARLHHGATRLANADVPQPVLDAVRIGCIVAPRNSAVGDVLYAFQKACMLSLFGMGTGVAALNFVAQRVAANVGPGEGSVRFPEGRS